MLLIRALVAAGLLLEMTRRHVTGPGLAAAVGLLSVLSPLAAVMATAAASVVRVAIRWSRRRARDRSAAADVVLLSELTGLGLSAGLPFTAALGLAAGQVHPALRDEVRSVLRRGTGYGAPLALREASGRATALYRTSARAAATGAPLLGAVVALASDQQAEQLARATANARKLPVRLLFPLALLILPGFLVLAIGPTLLTAIERLAL